MAEGRQNVAKQSDLDADELRERFREAGVCAISLISSPGSGKTAFLERTLALLQPNYRVAALAGDLATIRKALEEGQLEELDFLFLEKVENLVCQASYDVGEDVRVVLLSVTEGEDKPLKYPTIFNTADLAILSKMDLAEATAFDLAAARANILLVRPGMPVLEVSAKSGAGMEDWLRFLQGLGE